MPGGLKHIPPDQRASFGYTFDVTGEELFYYGYSTHDHNDLFSRLSKTDSSGITTSSFIYHIMATKFLDQAAKVCAIMKKENGGVIDTCEGADKSSADIYIRSPVIYKPSDFVTRAHVLSYYAWMAGSNWTYVINAYRLTDTLKNKGYKIISLEDFTGKTAESWPGDGYNYNLISGFGGCNDGKTQSYNYSEGTISRNAKDHNYSRARFNDSSIWTQLYNAKIYDYSRPVIQDTCQATARFYAQGKPDTYYVGTWHSPGSSGNWGAVAQHEFIGKDNYGNKIDVFLPVCAGSYAYDGKCNTN